MNAKRFLIGGLIASMMMINFAKVSADEVEVFGGEFENSKPAENQSQVLNQSQQNQTQEIPAEDEELGDVLKFDDLNRGRENNLPTNEEPEIIQEPQKNLDITYTPQNQEPSARPTKKTQTKQTKLKMQKPRFVKLAMDESYIYYLDKQSVSWKRIPYFAEEYMADVWIVMVERDDEDIVPAHELDAVIFAKEQGQQLPDSDIEVLQHRKYYMEHYYLRPKTEQIQFLSELEIVDRPQNTTAERKYDYQNWEYLIPGSTESIIYQTVIKTIGKSKATERGHMTFADMFEEYARISIR